MRELDCARAPDPYRVPPTYVMNMPPVYTPSSLGPGVTSLGSLSALLRMPIGNSTISLFPPSTKFGLQLQPNLLSLVGLSPVMGTTPSTLHPPLGSAGSVMPSAPSSSSTTAPHPSVPSPMVPRAGFTIPAQRSSSVGVAFSQAPIHAGAHDTAMGAGAAPVQTSPERRSTSPTLPTAATSHSFSFPVSIADAAAASTLCSVSTSPRSHARSSAVLTTRPLSAVASPTASSPSSDSPEVHHDIEAGSFSLSSTPPSRSRPLKRHRGSDSEGSGVSRAVRVKHESTSVSVAPIAFPAASRRSPSEQPGSPDSEGSGESNGPVRAHVCHECGRTFQHKSTLKRHSAIHDTSQQLSCEQCGKRFSRADRLRNHARVHTGERPFVCEVEGCGKRFGDRSNFVRHSQAHNAEKPSCPICKRQVHARSMQRHLRRKHGEQSPELLARRMQVQPVQE